MKKEPSDWNEQLHGADQGNAERLADVRRRVVARGKVLVADPNYPDLKTLNAVARVLARNWQD